MIDVDWSAPKKACQTPGCNHPNFHVCTYGQSMVVPKEILHKHTRPRKRKKTTGKTEYQSEPWRESIAEATRARWDKYRAETAERDRQVIERYKNEPIGMRKLGVEFGISHGKVVKILSEARERGEVEIRPKHYNAEKKVSS